MKKANSIQSITQVCTFRRILQLVQVSSDLTVRPAKISTAVPDPDWLIILIRILQSDIVQTLRSIPAAALIFLLLHFYLKILLPTAREVMSEGRQNTSFLYWFILCMQNSVKCLKYAEI